MFKRIFKTLLWLFLVLTLTLVCLVIYVKVVARIHPPETGLITRPVVIQTDSSAFVAGNNWFRRSESGLYELYVEGPPLERGITIGELTKDLFRFQEKAFNDQIRKIVPSALQLQLLKYFVGWFSRDIEDHVPEEYKLEIYGLSLAASHDYDHIASPYQRVLNYHGAHDIGHALQNMSLVGCTSFATWNEFSEDSTLTIGRNFDFFVGEDFSRNKIVAFYEPSTGNPFMMVTFAGMIGVLSGMNTEGLTVTINAAKSEIPLAAATPVSLVAREILQYASTIEEAYAILEKRELFVAESFLIGSARDGKAAIIEKSNESIGLYDPDNGYIICTNHFQSPELSGTSVNQQHIAESASGYRYRRVEELLDRNFPNNVPKTISILRDQRGINDEDIGYGNEKLINQLIAHHAIVFQPERKLVWVSTAPWQLGKFVCYDLEKVFNLETAPDVEIYEKELEIPADTFLTTSDFRSFLKMSKYRFPFATENPLNPDSIVHWNPNSYYSYLLAGDYYYESGNMAAAEKAYSAALEREIATGAEREHILRNLKNCIARQE